MMMGRARWTSRPVWTTGSVAPPRWAAHALDVYAPSPFDSSTDAHTFFELRRTYAAAAAAAQPGIDAALARRLAAASLPLVRKADKDVAAFRAADPEVGAAAKVAIAANLGTRHGLPSCPHFAAGRCGYAANCRKHHG